MKNFVGKLFVGRSAKFNVLLVLCLFAFVGLGCFGSGRSKDAKPIPAAFLGDWQGQDGSTLSIRGDGTGDYRSGGKKVEGGTAEVNETDRTISITFFGIGETLKIDSPPQGDTMKLNGVTYKRRGGSSLADTDSTDNSSNKSKDLTKRNTSTSTTKANAAKYEVPEDAEMQELTRTALLDFNDAVQEGDFTDFHSTISKTWQKQTTPERFNSVFSEFISKKVNISSVSSTEAEFTSADVETEGGAKKLIAKGCYDVSPRPVKFILKWIPEGKEWKLFGIEVDTTSSAC